MKYLLLLPLVLVTFVSGEAWAQPQVQPPAVASGSDLVAWQQLEHLRLDGEAATEAYRRFVTEWAQSPLAVAAWGRLVELGAASTEHRDPAVARRLAAVAARWEALQSALADASGEPVYDIDL